MSKQRYWVTLGLYQLLS